MILALDFPSGAACFGFLLQLERAVPEDARLRWVKVGLELFLAEGLPLLARLRSAGYEIFLDLKLHDIPNTVAGAVRSVLPYAPRLLTLHGGGGPAMLAAAAAATRGSSTQLLAVTVLTSMDGPQLEAVGLPPDPATQVARLARLAGASGLDGVVCSVEEAALVRGLLPEALLVTPGIRPQGSPGHDQQRTGTPAEALRRGADKMVIGRPITGAINPPAAYLAILDEVAAAF